MIRKATIINIIFTICLLYIVSPWFFEKKMLFNEILSAIGLGILLYHRGRVGKDSISILVVLLISLGTIHAITSLPRMDSFYYYLRNAVIVYSMMTFFIGYYLLPYLGSYFQAIRKFLRQYIIIFLFVPVKYLFERFGMAMLFPGLFKKATPRVFLLIILINIIYGFTYNSLTALVLAAFYILLILSPSYKFFAQVVLCMFLGFTAVFIYVLPYLAIISRHYFSISDTYAIHEVMRSNPILSIDGNSTWRMVLWRQIIVDAFPGNIYGMGFGTKALTYFPIEDPEKLPSLPYVVGSHNSYVYLFGRLGILYVVFIVPIYIRIFKEYFYHKAYYYANDRIMLFWSFFAITIIAAFNPTLESPIYAGAYWLLLGMLANAINNRQFAKQ